MSGFSSDLDFDYDDPAGYDPINNPPPPPEPVVIPQPVEPPGVLEAFALGFGFGGTEVVNVALKTVTFGTVNLDAQAAKLADAAYLDENTIRLTRLAANEGVTAAFAAATPSALARLGTVPGVSRIVASPVGQLIGRGLASRPVQGAFLVMNGAGAINNGGAAIAAAQNGDWIGVAEGGVATIESLIGAHGNAKALKGSFTTPRVVSVQPVDKFEAANRELNILQDFCFAPETLIATPGGPQEIRKLRENSTIRAFNHRTGEWVDRRVAKFHESIYEGPLLTITTEAGSVRCTVYHPFWVVAGRDLAERSVPRELAEDEDQGQSLDGRWVNSHDLRCGDRLIGQDGKLRTVLKIEQKYVQAFLVHNLTIDEQHTFAVGPDAVLVHNTDGCNIHGVTRSKAAKSEFLKSLADDYRTPSAIKPWLREGRVPPGFNVDHIKPLSIGGADLPSNMRLQGTDLHILHHRFYRPWQW